MAVYATIGQAMAHLRETQPAREADVQLKLDQAEAIVVDYLNAGRTRWVTGDPPVPIPLPAPGEPESPIIQSAILRLTAGLYERRGDTDSDSNYEAVWKSITLDLARLRDPAVA